MVTNVIIVVLMAVVIATAINIIGDIRKKNNSRISFKESMDLTELPVVTFYNENNKLNFLLDTGSNLSYINKAILDNLTYNDVDEKIMVLGTAGECSSEYSCIMTITYNNQNFEEKFSIMDMDDIFKAIKQESGVQIHGILGSKFFEKYRYVIDFSKLVAYMK